MAATVTELWADRELMHDRYGWTALRTFDVVGPKTKEEAEAAVMIRKGEPHDDYPLLLALRQPFAVWSQHNRWRVQVIYREPEDVPPVVTAHGEYIPVVVH